MKLTTERKAEILANLMRIYKRKINFHTGELREPLNTYEISAIYIAAHELAKTWEQEEEQ